MFVRLTPGVRMFTVKNVLTGVVAISSAAESINARTYGSASARVTYSVEYKNDLNDPSWTKLKDIPSQAASGDVDVTDLAPSAQMRFYRIVTPSQP